jgi:ADP-heptose:LPS heptosyltransferase
MAGKTTLSGLICLIKLSDLVIGVDSGTIHIAAALNKKIIDIIRKSQSEIWYPWQNDSNYELLVSENENLNKIKKDVLISAYERLIKK